MPAQACSLLHSPALKWCALLTRASTPLQAACQRAAARILPGPALSLLGVCGHGTCWLSHRGACGVVLVGHRWGIRMRDLHALSSPIT